MSAAAATLIGLLFVVIALVAGGTKDLAEDTAKIRVYLTPTVVYFASVLGVAALLTFPTHTRLSAVLCLSVAGLVGLLYGLCAQFRIVLFMMTTVYGFHVDMV